MPPAEYETSQFLSSHEVRAALQNERMTSLLPPVGTDVFRRFTLASLEEIRQQHECKKEKRKAKKKEAEKDPLRPATHLEAGKSLPFVYGSPPPELVNTPLEDLDPFYQSQKTFIVLCKRNNIHRFNAESACYLLSPFNCLRTTAIKILIHRFYGREWPGMAENGREWPGMAENGREWLGMARNGREWPRMAGNGREWPGMAGNGQEWPEKAGNGRKWPGMAGNGQEWPGIYTFIAIYAFEALLKMLSRGVCIGRFTFLRDPWNWLDVLIIVTAVLTDYVAGSGLSVLMVITLFMKLLACSPDLKKTVEALAQALKRLTHAAILTMFGLSILAMLGLQLFMGNLQHKCIFWSNISNVDSVSDHYGNGTGDFAVTMYSPGAENYYFIPDSMAPLLCGNSSGSGRCPEGTVCMKTGANPNYGYTSYDSFGWSLLAVLRLMMQDFSDNLVQMTLRAAGQSNVIFFVLIFYPGCFLLLSLLLAAVAIALAEQVEADASDAKQTEEEFCCIVELLKRREEEASDKAEPPAEQESPQKKPAAQGHRQENITMEEDVDDGRPSCWAPCDAVLTGDCCGCWRGLKQRAHAFIMNPLFDQGIIICIVINTVLAALEHYPMTSETEDILSISYLVFTLIYTAELLIKLLALGLCGYFKLQSLRLARWWPTLQILMKIIGTSVGSLSVVLLSFVLMASVVGMHLFKEDYLSNVCKIAHDCLPPRWHMGDFFHSFMLIFRVLCGEWIESMWDCMEVSNQVTCVIFFMAVLIIGNLLFSNSIKDCKDEQLALTFASSDPSSRSPADVESCHRCCGIPVVNTSQGPGTVWFKFRRVCVLIVQHRCFDHFFIFIILLSSAALAFEDIYLPQRPVLQMVLDKADVVFTYLFLVEMLLKWFAFGFRKYFSSFWCWLDFLILDVSLFSLIANMQGYSTEPLRALRILRILSRFKGTRMVLQTLAESLPPISGMFLVVVFVWLLFSIMGVNMFAGKFQYCFNETSKEYMLMNKSDCYALMEANNTDLRWLNEKFNFDNVGMGFVSLLILMASAGWLGIMYSAVDSTQVENEPGYESNLYIYLYFVIFIIFGCFMTSNFLIRGKHLFMTEEQQKYSMAVRSFFSKKTGKAVSRPKCRCLVWFFDLVTAPAFEVFMVLVICVNMMILMVVRDDHSHQTETVLEWLHFVIILIFTIEFILKIIGLRQHYFSNGLNILDFILLIFSIIGMFIADLLHQYFVCRTLLSVLRLARVIRLLCCLRWARGIRMLLLGFMTSLPALFNIGFLLFIIAYMYSYIGMRTFAYVKKELLIDDMFNFETLGNSMISMTLISTSTSWEGLLSPIMNTPPDCDPDIPGLHVKGTCSSPTAGIIFFTSYILLYLLLVVHLFIAVILESFNIRDWEDTEPLNDDHLQMFYETWRKLDPDASQVIPYSELSDFCDALEDPLRIPKPNTIKLIHMDLPLLPGDKIFCLDVLEALTAQVSYDPISTTLQRKQEDVAASVIQRAFRKHLLEERGANKMAVQPVD
ncbi:sodium channel protein type 4 subunit alpha B-like [Xenentodon cancila]